MGPLAALRGRPGAGRPPVRTSLTRGSLKTRVRIQGTDEATARLLKGHALGQAAGLVAATQALPTVSGGAVQQGRCRDGTALQLSIGPEGVSVVPSHDALHPALPAPVPSRLQRLAAPLLDRLPNRKQVARASMALCDPGLHQVPMHLVTQVAASPSGHLFGIGPDGDLYRLDSAGKRWSAVEADGALACAHLGPQRDGRLYAVRAGAEGGAEIVRLDGDRAEQVHANDRPVTSYSVAADGRLLALDDRGRLTIAQEDREASARLSLVGEDGKPTGAEAPPQPVCVAWAGEQQAYVGGSDGRMYRLDLSRSPQHGGFVAERVADPFEGRPDLDRNSTLVDFGHTIDPDSGRPTLHALFRGPAGEVFSAYHDEGGFKPGWRFDSAFIAQNRSGMQPIRVAPGEAVALDRDGVQLGLRRGHLHLGHEGGQWTPLQMAGLSDLKSNPNGLGRSYALQDEQQADGSVRRRLVRIDLEGLHPSMPAATRPRPGTPEAPVEARLSELAAGDLRDFAVLEDPRGSHGGETRQLFYVDESNRLFSRDLTCGAPAHMLALSDVGRLDQIALDGSGDLFAVAHREGKAAQLYQLKPQADGRQDWTPLPLPLAPGHRLTGISAGWTGVLQVRVEPPEDGGAAATYRYSPATGLAPLDRQGAIDALRAAGGREFHLPGLPAAHVRAEVLGFKTTSRPFKSASVNWFRSSWAHARSLASAPKVGARWVQHRRHGREGLQPLYQATAASARWYEAHLSHGAAAPGPTDLPKQLQRLAAQDEALAAEMTVYVEDLMRGCRQALQHIGHATGFIDANLADARDFKSHKPRHVDDQHDLVDDLHRWFTAFSGAADSDEARQAHALLQRMRHAPERLYLRQPGEQAQGRSSKDGELLQNARILRSLQAVHEMQALLRTEPTAAAARSGFDRIRQAYAEDPVTQYAGLSFKNSQQVEDAYDMVRSMSRMLNKWNHPLNRTLADSYGVASPSRRKAELVKAAERNRVDPNVLAHYGAPDSATLAWWLKDARLPEHGPLVARIEAEALQELKQHFSETLLAMKTKETFVLDRSYGGGIDPLGYVHNLKGVFAFAGGMVGRDYNIGVEVMGDDPRGGDIAFMFEKARDASLEVAAGWGKSSGHGPGVLHHYLRGAAIGELGMRQGHGDSFWFMVPRDSIPEFTDRLFDFGKKGEAALKDLPGLLAPSYERETAVRDELALEAKAQGFLRMGPSHYEASAGGHFWAARPSIFHAGVGIGIEKSTFKTHGQTLEGELQTGAERHRYISREADIRLPGLRFRSWFNFPQSESAVHQVALGFGNTDSELTVGVHDKSGAKCEYRAAVPAPVRPAQWAELLGDAARAYPEHAARLQEAQAWAQQPETFAQRLGELRAEVARSWADHGSARKDLVEGLDLMRWQHALALAGKPMHFGVIHELRESNAARLTAPAFWDRAGQRAYGQAGPQGHPLREMQARVAEDPTLRQLLKDLQATHPGRIKVKMELKPEAMERLVQMQLAYPQMAESQVAAFIRDPHNFRINTIAAMKSSATANGASVWPVIGITSGTSASIEEVKGSVHFDYGADGQLAGYVVDSAFARDRKSVRQARADMAKAGSEPLTLAPRQKLPVGQPAQTPGAGFFDAPTELPPPSRTLGQLFEAEGAMERPSALGPGARLNASEGEPDPVPPGATPAPHKPKRGVGAWLRHVFQR